MKATTPVNQQPQFQGIQRTALIVGAVALVLGLVGIFVSGTTQFFQSYIFAYLFWFGLSAGSLGVLMIQHLSGGLWGPIARRPLEASAKVIVVMGLLFLPMLVNVFMGSGSIYPWAWPHEQMVEVLGEERAHLVDAKALYLNPTFFAIRTVIYFALWAGLAFVLSRWSDEQERNPTLGQISRFRGFSGVGLVLFVLAMTFASVDWTMSIDPTFFSSIYGLIYAVGQGLITFSSLVIFFYFVRNTAPFSQYINNNRFHDLGKFMLGFTVLWTYVNFSQFLIIWSGNLPEEIPWYVVRGEHGWDIVSIFLVVFHFFVPLFILLSRPLKRNPRRLVFVAAGVLFMRVVDLFWLVKPTFTPEGFTISWLDIVLFVAFGGIWIGAFFWMLQQRSYIIATDYRIAAAGADHLPYTETNSVPASH